MPAADCLPGRVLIQWYVLRELCPSWSEALEERSESYGQTINKDLGQVVKCLQLRRRTLLFVWLVLKWCLVLASLLTARQIPVPSQFPRAAGTTRHRDLRRY